MITRDQMRTADRIIVNVLQKVWLSLQPLYPLMQRINSKLALAYPGGTVKASSSHGGTGRLSLQYLV